jgi:hypothetical protein
MGYYWTNEDEERAGEVIDRSGPSVLVRDLETGVEIWIDERNVDPETLYEWNRDNGQFGVGA